jgi:hypothetical protein
MDSISFITIALQLQADSKNTRNQKDLILLR